MNTLSEKHCLSYFGKVFKFREYRFKKQKMQKYARKFQFSLFIDLREKLFS